ncbi:voltage-gated shaker-like K+ channel, subunit [Xylariaceae sp. FL0255]|nr:voltage-gated shaker-like K+ channel, subunit [Xylariaceae sp. FL0255]
MPTLLGKEVGPIGLGLMGFTWRSNPPSDEQAFETMRAALQAGNTCWNGGEFYGPPERNSLVLLEKYFEKYPEDADKVILNIKGGANPKTYAPDGSPENTRRSIDTCIAQLKGRKKIDMFEFARRDPNVPLEVTLGIIDKEYVQTGKIGGISLSEVRAETIHEAAKITKICAVELEVSMFSIDFLTNGVADACAQYGIPIIAYSPIGRGMLTGAVKKREDVNELLLNMDFPRFRPDAFEANLVLVEKVESLAKKKGCTPAQLAINWTRVLANKRKGMPPAIIPIPGATTVARVEENSRVLDLTEEEMKEIDDILATFMPVGDRYPNPNIMDT